MDINHHYWEENSNIQQLKYERCNDMENGEFHINSCNSNDGEHPRLKDEPLLPYRLCDSNLNFATVACSEDDSEYSQYKKNKVSRQDPMSHRIIEKRRRDRMNNCLADLSRLIPTDYLKKGRGRIEKTEIIEMAIRHIKNLQQAHRSSGREDAERSYSHEQYRLGYQECMSETMRFLVEVEGYFAREALCVRLISHLQKHCDALLLREKRVSSTTNVPMEKEYMQGHAVPTAATASAGISNGSLRPQSPGRPLSEHYDNASQLRDMLTCSMVKDEVRVPLSPQLMRPTSREDVVAAAAVAPRVLSPCSDKHPEVADSGSAPTGALGPKSPATSDRARNMSETESYTNGVSLYKFKNNIKQRFSRDLHAENNQCKLNKRRKVIESGRRNSVTTETYSSENHSSPIDSSQCSPPSSEMYRISSESENARISPTGSSVSDVRNIDTRTPTRYMPHKGESVSAKAAAAAAVCYDRFSPTPKPAYPLKGGLPLAHASDADKASYGVPIFALHAKGSFYVPLTIDYHILAPYLHHHNIFLDMLPNVHNIILHPVNINVNFQTGYFNTASTTLSKNHAKHKLDGQNAWH